MAGLTDLAIRKLPYPQGGSIKHLDASLPGFGVRCTSKSKAFFVMFGPKRRLKTLGKWPELSLKDARQAARELLVDPPTVRRVSPKLHAVRDRFLADCRTRLRPSTTERYYYALRSIPDARLDQLSTDISEPNQLKALKVFYNWCIERGITDRNPFHRHKVRFATRDRLLTDEEVAAIWQVEQGPFSDIVKLLILTGQRRNQIWRFDPAWIGDGELTFPAEIMKSARSHTIPLTSYQEFLPPESFRFNSWSKSKRRFDQACGASDWVLHDIRRYFSSTMARLDVPLHVTEQLIDHRSQISGVAAIYNRYNFLKEMRVALERYEAHIREIV